MSRAIQPYYDALSTLLLQESGERLASDVRELRPQTDLEARLEGLEALEHPIEAAARCFQAVWHVESFKSSLFCIRDLDTAESVVVYASGPDAEGALLSRDPGHAEPSGTAASFQEPFTLGYSDPGPRVSRHRLLPAVGEVLVAPVMSFGRCVGTFEVLTRGPNRFGNPLACALGYAAGRYADFLAARGVLYGFSVLEREGGYILRSR